LSDAIGSLDLALDKSGLVGAGGIACCPTQSAICSSPCCWSPAVLLVEAGFAAPARGSI
jgi:hypothetical protein